MQRNINLKVIAITSILVLIVGFINTARMKQQAYVAHKISESILADKPPGIDPSFFKVEKIIPTVQPAVPKLPSSIEDIQNQVLSQSIIPDVVSPFVAKKQTLEDIITANSYLVGNLVTGRIYFEKNSTDVLPIASITKLITAVVVEKNMNSDTKITMASSSVTGYEQIEDIYPGETFSASDLLAGMLLISSNDAALSFANSFGYPAFISLMKEESQFLGMKSTSFVDPSGLSAGNTSSAKDLFKLARYLYIYEPGILNITKTPSFTLATTTEHDAHNFVNIDPFTYDPHYIGGKTGRTVEAGETMLSMFKLSQNGISYPIVIIVLHSNQDARQIDSSILLGRVLKAISI